MYVRTCLVLPLCSHLRQTHPEIWNLKPRQEDVACCSWVAILKCLIVWTVCTVLNSLNSLQVLNSLHAECSCTLRIQCVWRVMLECYCSWACYLHLLPFALFMGLLSSIVHWPERTCLVLSLCFYFAKHTLKSEIWNLKPEISILKSEIWNLKYQLWNLKSETWNLKPQNEGETNQAILPWNTP